MKRALILCILTNVFLISCSKENLSNHSLENRAAGRDVCGTISSFKVTERKESNGTYTLTADFTIKNCTNIVPIDITLEITNLATASVRTQKNLPFSNKINVTDLSVGDNFSFRVISVRPDTGDVLSDQTIGSVVVAK